ncbi:DegT/DnrJ/EryC1/StrS family aminotransferase [Facklamia hominis]|uniref:DegT/DnrJ/EryC1/StrS family aminotransferase n=1 Tax=Facklamia hominis TaxID=178214 RepID=UPI0029D4184E|nr:DegT/DnrJ/EryC1/StrS family aminotransferase [Facklamia hominis]WPJ91645.1 DegT/DnrJ/EryC1/StrS family aminotransferase [Facklamia hominis]
MKKMNIPFSPPDISQKEIDYVVDALKSGWITTGPKCKELEQKLSEFCGTAKTVAVNSSTAAMEMTLRVLGVGPGDEVITSAYTYTASASVIDHVGAKIVLVDTAKDSFEMDYDQLEAAITEKTKVIIPVDLGGVMCDYDRLYQIVEAKKHLFHPKKDSLQEKFDRVILLADSAHALGAKYHGKPAGSVADFTTFSFHAVKNFTTAEGGAVTWLPINGVDDEWLYKQFMLLILHGQNKDALAKTKAGAWEYDIVAPYFKANLTDIHAAIGLGQLERYPSMLERRHEIIRRYDAICKELAVRPLNHFKENCYSSGHLYLLRIDGYGEKERNQLIQKMAEAGIACNVHYKPLPMMTAYKNLGFNIEDFPNAYDQYKNEVTLPLHTLLSDEEVEYIASNLVSLMNND